eukprot:TRINITY_DN2956_c0_g1_i1.p1 TRINITY_DN2956_c0_g1~~TRINITY_DN2956_c0_g1_i1.p1  ORF type:complete len:974 (+),score=168.41 TRINITY_DN2956_c0_g1_i1:252-3173(+)
MFRERASSQPGLRGQMLRSTPKLDATQRTKSLTDIRELHQQHKLKIINELGRPMRRAKRGFRANLTSTLSFPNRQPQSPELVLATGRAASRPSDMGPLELPFKDRHALSARALDLCKKSVPYLRGAPPVSVSSTQNNSQQLSKLKQLGLDEVQPSRTSSHSKGTAVSKGTQLLRNPALSGSTRKSSKQKPAGDAAKTAEEVKQTSPAKRQTSKRKPVGIEGRKIDAKLPPPSIVQAGPMMPSVRDALDRFLGPGSLSAHETARMQITFARFSDGTQINRNMLPEALATLGYISLTDESEIDDMAGLTTQFSTMDFTDFCDFCIQASMCESETLHEKCDAWIQTQQSDHPTCGLEEGLQSFMESLGILCTGEIVTQCVELGAIAGRECNSTEVLLRFAAAYRALEGFTEDELKELWEAFDECEAETGFRAGPGGKMIKAAEISNGLLSWAGLYCVDQLKELLEKLEDSLESETPPGCCFFEFVVCARRLRQLMLYEVHEEFEKCVEGEEMLIQGEELRELCHPLGFTLLDAEFAEFLEDQDITEESLLDFGACWKFVLAVREANGFTKEEAEELEAAFDSFCDESGEMPNLGVADLLQYIGFENTLEQVMFMVRQVDFNGNGTMDSGEFMRLMRVQREESIATYRAVYHEHRLFEPSSEHEVAAALTKCHIPPGIKIMESLYPLLDEHGAENGMSFEGFLQIAETCRRLYPVEKRKRAHFKEEEVALIQTAFMQQDSAGCGYISLADLLHSLADSGLPVNTIPGRGKICEQLEKARESARKAGVDEAECGTRGSPRIHMVPVVHLVREILRKHDKEVSEKQEAAMKSITFSAMEMDDFRKLFDSMADAPPEVLPSFSSKRRGVAGDAESQVNLKSPQLTLTKVIERFKFIPRVAVDKVLKLTQSSKFRVGAKQRKDLSVHIMKLANSRGVDFPAFAQVMQWMVEQKFGDVPDSKEEVHSLQTLDDLSKIRQRRR